MLSSLSAPASARVLARAPAPSRSPLRARRSAVRPAMAALSQDELKQQAAWQAVDYVKSGMRVGLGTGSTAAFAVARIGELMAKGELKDIVAVPTSVATYEQAKSECMGGVGREGGRGGGLELGGRDDGRLAEPRRSWSLTACTPPPPLQASASRSPPWTPCPTSTSPSTARTRWTPSSTW